MEAITNPEAYSDHEDLSGNWNWDRETRIKAQGLYSSLTKFSTIITLISLMNCLDVLHPLSLKLQCRLSDILAAHNLIASCFNTLKIFRSDNDVMFLEWYETSKFMAEKLGIEVDRPRTIASHRQQHRSNVPAETNQEYFKRSIAVPFLDHLISEIETRFIDRRCMKLFSICPAEISKFSNYEIQESVDQ